MFETWRPEARILIVDNEPANLRFLEELLEAEELDDAEVDRGVEPEPALVGAERAVELDAESSVDVDLPAVVSPGHPKDDLPFWLADPLDRLVLGKFGVLGEDRADGRQHLADGLEELQLAGVAALHGRVGAGELLVDHGFLTASERRQLRW